MKIDISSVNKEEFSVREVIIAEEKCYLINPLPNFFDWREEVLHLRSSLWNSQGELISGSYKKFFNFEEKPAIRPFTETNGFSAYDKLDGSTLILSSYKGELIARTRGTSSLDFAYNGKEIEIFKNKYSNFFKELIESNGKYTFLFEWTTPSNKIVLDYGNEPEIYLTSIVDNSEYSLFPQAYVETYAKNCGLLRPKKFEVDNLKDFIEHIKDRNDIEGICLYYNNDQDIRKVKSLYYLKLHAFRSELSEKNLINLYIEWNQPTQEEMVKKIEQEFDFECAQMAEKIMEKVFPVIREVEDVIQNIKNFVEENKTLEQKEFALKLQSVFPKDFISYGFSWRREQKIDLENIGKMLKLHFKEEKLELTENKF